MFHRRRFRLRLRSRLLTLGERTLIMGILNITPDSFSDGGEFLDSEAAIARALQLERDGADIVDIGGESTRPGATPIASEEELRRILPVIRVLREKLRVPMSVDTRRAEVAEAALAAGAEIVNDVSGLRMDPRLGAVARRARAPDNAERPVRARRRQRRNVRAARSNRARETRGDFQVAIAAGSWNRLRKKARTEF
jgi:dihydropteroate synthase